jgi:hypothetical protein
MRKRPLKGYTHFISGTWYVYQHYEYVKINRQARQSIADSCPGFLVENAGQPVKFFSPRQNTHNIAASRSGQSVAVPPCT